MAYQKSIDVSIIIVNYNTRQMTAECINSVFEKTSGIEFEVILVDNASTDGSKEHFEKDIRIKYIYSEENLGFGRANNLGFKQATGRNVLCLNPDTILQNNAIKILSDFLDTNDNAGGCGGCLLNRKNEPSNSYLKYAPGIKLEIINLIKSVSFNRLYNDIQSCKSKSIMEVDSIIGADLMIKKSILNKVLGFCSDYFMFLEETDLCFRIKKEGYSLFYVPTARIVHLEGQSFVDPSKINYKKLIFYEEGRRMYYKKNISYLNAKLSYLLIIFRLILSFAIKHKPSTKYSLKILLYTRKQLKLKAMQYR